MNRQEEISNLDKVKFIIGKGQDFWLDRWNDSTEDGEQQYTKEQYVNCLFKWLPSVLKKKGNMKTSYKYSTKMINCGRSYVKGFGIQSLKKDIRGFLCSDNYFDYDMVNAHPTILLHIAKKYFPDSHCTYLQKYVDNRAFILSKYNFTKKDFLTEMNKSTPYKNKENKFLYNVNIEIKQLQQKIFQSLEEPFINIPKSCLKKYNKEGGFMNRVICEFENNILNKVSKDKKDIPFFDGFFSTKQLDCDILNEKTKEFGIKWAKKEHDTSIQMIFDEEFDAELPEYETPYETMKKEFEKTHFMTTSPLQYYTEIEGKLSTYSKNDFMDLTAPYQIIEHGIETSFFNLWLKDKERRKYKRLGFHPDINNCPEDEFNLFKGFKSQYIPEDERVDTELYWQLLTLLTGNDEESFVYLCGYIAHMFQNTNTRPEVMVVFRGMKGTGKDLSFNFLRNIMGNEYCYDTADIDEIVGKNNKVGASQKLLCMINELEGKDGFANDKKLKQFMTEETHTIGEKYEKPRIEENYQRMFVAFNGLNSINITGDNRRVFICKTANKREKEFYAELHSNLKDQSFLNSVYSQFMDMDISKFNIRTFPTTEAETMAKENNTNPIYKYLHHLIIEEGIKDILNVENNIFKDKKKDIYYFSTKSFIKKFKKYLVNEGIYGEDYINKFNFKSIVMLLNDIKISKKKKKVKGTVINVYVIDKEECEENLLTKYNPEEEDIEEIDVEDIDIMDCDFDDDE